MRRAGCFLQKIRFELNLTDIITTIKKSISEKFIPDNRINEVFERLDSNIRSDNFIKIKSGEPIVISFENFSKKYRVIFESVRSSKLPIEKFEPVLNGNFLAERFIQQLIKIGEINPDEEDLIIQYITEKVQMTTTLQKWYNDGFLVADQITDFHDETYRIWATAFRAAFRRKNTLEEHQILEAALNLVDKIRSTPLLLDGQSLPTHLGHGEFYHLSDIQRIGWHPDWKE